MKFRYILFCLVFLTACTGNMKQIDDSIFIHDNSSKVWLIDKLLSEGRDYTSVQFEYREMIIFHQSRNAYFYRLNEFGKQRGKKMTFHLDREKNEFIFHNEKGDYRFDVVLLQRTKMILKPKQKTYPFTIVLIPFPEY